MMTILFFSWLGSLLLVYLAERSSDSPSLTYEEKIERIREKNRKIKEETEAMLAKHKEQQRLYKEVFDFIRQQNREIAQKRKQEKELRRKQKQEEKLRRKQEKELKQRQKQEQSQQDITEKAQ